MSLKAPFPWFGGKRRVADVVIAAHGDVGHYVEPFAGSLAVLLCRPPGVLETVNDRDCYVANFWRALKHAPDEVAEHACDPVNEADLFARHMWLVNEGRRRVDAINADPEFFDAKVAGWWVWGQCAWIGSGWCSGKGPWVTDGQRPHLGDEGRGVNRKLPHLGTAGQGVNRKLPHLAPGRGVNRQLPHLDNKGQGGSRRETITAYMRQLSARLERVRVCCGDWSRVVTTGALTHPRDGHVGVFLDPPYLKEVRTGDLYSTDDANVAHEVREWAIANGDDPRLRIVLAGYEDEHAAHMPASWRVMAYSGKRAYGSTAGGGVNGENRHKERLWFSPACLDVDAAAPVGGCAQPLPAPVESAGPLFGAA